MGYKAFDWELIRKDHSRRYVETSVTLKKDSKDQPIGFQGIARDITERKRAEERVLMATERLQYLLSGSSAVIYTAKTSGDYGATFISENVTQMVGYGPQEFLEDSSFWIDHIHPDDVEKVAYEVPLLFEKKLNIYEYRFKCKDATYIWVRDEMKLVEDQKGNPLEIIGFWAEITERKRAEEALRDSEVIYRNLFESIPIGLYRSTPDGSIIDVNSALVQMFNYPDKESLTSSKSTDTYVDPEERNIWKAAMKDKGIVKDNVKQLRTRDGRVIWVEENARAVYDGEGRIQWYDGSLIDITERIRSEEKERALEAQLRQAQKMESIGTLAGGIAHDFNNILGIIIGNTELAIDDVPEWNPAKECLKEIRAASMRAKDVVRHILSFARKTPAQRKPIQISTIIRDSLKLMRASIPTTIEIRQNISCTTEMILADSTEVNQILMNLCTNAVHALSEETGVLEVTLENEKLTMKNEELGLEAGLYAKLTVRDTGEGIDPEIMGRIFDPYFTTKDIGKGTGMGLAVAYGIVKKHDGAIKVQSELGKGTVIEVLFPLIEETVEPEVKEEPEDLPTGSERILFVDDEESLVKMGKQMLGRLGYQMVTKTNPEEALALFKDDPIQFDLVITDMAMPQMAGDRLVQELMKIRKDIPVILCTGHSARIDEDRAKKLGLAAYVMKPLVKSDFANTVRKVLDAAKESTQD